jgi:hypothetical protein
MCSKKCKKWLSPRKLMAAPHDNVRDGALLATILMALAMLVASPMSQAQGPPRGAKKRPNAASKAPGADVQPKAVFVKFPDWVACVAFAPDHRTLAAGSYGVVKLLDVVEQQEMAALPEPAGFVKSAAFSADGKTLVTGSYQSLLIWDVDARKVIKTVKGHRGYVTALAFSPDGKTVASASDDESVRLWDTTTFESRGVLPGILQPALAVAYSHDGRLLAVATGDATRPTKKGFTRLYDAAGNLQFELEGHNRAVTAVAFSPDDSVLATASADESIKLWNTTSGKEVRELEGHSRPVNSVAFLADGKRLLSVCGGRAVGGNELKLWDLSSGKDVATVPAHEGPIHQLALSGDGKYLATSSLDKSVKVFEVTAILAAAGQAAGKSGEKEAEFIPDSPALPEPAVRETSMAAVIDPIADRSVSQETPRQLRAGIIGLDTSHAVAFTQILNDPKASEDVARCRVVAAYPNGSPDIKSSTDRVPEYTEKVIDLGVEIVKSIDELVQKVDVVLLETNDGRPHLEQALPVLKAGKAVFIDKPIAGSLTDAVAIFEAARQHKTPVFSSSSLRYVSSTQAIRSGKIGEVKGCDAYSPCPLEATHPDFFWYGIHGVETLFTVMGTGCESVTRSSTPAIDLAVGVWKGGRIGTFRGIRTDEGGGKADYGGTAFGAGGIQPLGTYEGYRPLVVEIVRFFRSGKAPVAAEETLEIYAFMEAADESKRQGGKPVTLESVLARARTEAARKISP